MHYFSRHHSQHPRSSKANQIKSQTWNVFFSCSSSTATRDIKNEPFVSDEKRSQKNRRMPSEFQTIEAHHFPSGSAAASLPLDFHPPSPLQLSALKIQKAKPKYLRDLQGISTNPRSFFKVQLLVPHKNLN